MTRFTQSYNGEDMDAELTTTEFQEAWAIVHSGSWSYLDEAAHRVATAATRKALTWAAGWLSETTGRGERQDFIERMTLGFQATLEQMGITPWEAPDGS